MKKFFAVFAVLMLIACGEDQTVAPAYDEPVAKIDTVIVSSTDTLFISDIDTILVSNTDTISVSLTDTVFVSNSDTVTVKDIVKMIDTVSIIDTVTFIDTISVVDTVKVPVVDTVKITDTVSVIDTVKVIDTVFVASSSSSVLEESSSSIVEESSSSVISSSSVATIRDSISTFTVDSKTYTIVSRYLSYLVDDPEPIFSYGEGDHLCNAIGAESVTLAEANSIKNQAFNALSNTANKFVGVLSNINYNMICLDENMEDQQCITKDKGLSNTTRIGAVGTTYIRGYANSKYYNIVHICVL